MAHIVSCMLDADGNPVLGPGLQQPYISKPASPLPPNDLQPEKLSSATEKPHIWRMHPPERKYQLFPKEKPGTPTAGKGLDPEQAFALAMGQNGEKTDKPSAGSALRLRIKEHNLNRRRKVSVPELGPMTTVQEVAMDSPTIPGRPPLHERSISAPGSSWKQHSLMDVTIANAATPDEKDELKAASNGSSESHLNASAAARQPLSPKSLAPLVIPTQPTSAPRLTRQLSLNRLRSGSLPVEPSIRSARTDESPMMRTPYTPYTPLSASTAFTTPKSAAISTASISTVPTPVSAPVESRASPKPWTDGNYALAATPKDKDNTTDSSATPRAEPEPRAGSAMGHRSGSVLGHRRNQSESASIMERGRPRKRSDTDRPSLQRTGSKRSKSAERRAFEYLPKGWKAGEATAMLNQTEAAALQKQALQQAARFEVLRKDDVDNLSRELRHLDERTEYLRRTYTSLRAGRRNLHSRICQYLRSPRTAKFSHESMLKQEEALAELDASIDDWVTKLEQAENRRTRVRQKLLEHVAAAATLPVSGNSVGVAGVSESLQLAMGIRNTGVANISTPPRSPTKPVAALHTHSSSPSPQRVVAQVPSTILEQPLIEEAAAIGLGLNGVKGAEGEAAAVRRANMESIRIYADSDVYALLADVEDAFSKMSNGGSGADLVKETANLSEDERKQVHRARSHELLSGLAGKTSNNGTPTTSTPTTATPALASAPAQPQPTPEAPKDEDADEVFLTNAVFQPEKSVLAI